MIMIGPEVERLVDIERLDIERLSRDVERVLQKDLPSQWRGVHLYMGKIRAEIGGVFDACKELVEESSAVYFSDFIFILRVDTATRGWPGGAPLRTSDYDCDEGSLISEDAATFLDMRAVVKVCLGGEEEPVSCGMTLVNRLFVKIVQWLGCESARGQAYIVDYLEKVYLYTALRNERERIKRDAYIEGVALPTIKEIIDEAAPVPPPVEEKVPAAGATTSAKRNSAREKEATDLTPAVKKHFKDARECKFIKRKKNGRYQWLLNDKEVALAFFLKNVYRDNPPWDSLNKLFFIDEKDKENEKAVGNLKSTYEGVEATQYWQARFGSEEGKKLYKDKKPPDWFVVLCNFFNL